MQQVVDKKLEMAAVWGPMAGYYKSIKKAPLVIQPVNLMDDTVPLEFDMAMATPRGRPEMKVAVEKAMRDSKDKIHAILVEYGVPLVKCGDCIIDGDLLSHGPYKPHQRGGADRRCTNRRRTSTISRSGSRKAPIRTPSSAMPSSPTMSNAWRYLVEHGADAERARRRRLHGARQRGAFRLMRRSRRCLLEHKADPNATDLSGWTPLMYASWTDDRRSRQTFDRARRTAST